MLASVTSLAEAETVRAGGADIIDLKDPANGPLGALSATLVAEIAHSMGTNAKLSAAAGTIPGAGIIEATRIAATGIDYVKIGFLSQRDLGEYARAFAAFPKKTKLIGVFFADCGPDLSLLRILAECGFVGVMLDTAKKHAGRLLDHMDVAALDRFVTCCRAHKLLTGLAGSLESPDVPRLLPLEPDFLGFRGSLCRGHSRQDEVDPASVKMIRDLIPRELMQEPTGENVAPDWRLWLGRGYIPAPENVVETDLIFVHDLVLPCAIGAYDFERGHYQKVRFNIDADVRRHDRRFDDMRDIFSYDVLIDSIKIMLGRGHVDLIETLASDIADEILRYACVARVCVRIEKLEVVEGAVGVEIKRERAREKTRGRPGNRAFA